MSWCMPKGYDIAGYTFNADMYCGTCVANMFDDELPGNPSEYLTAEAVLDTVAKARGIDRYDEYSYDSGDFPKVVFYSQVEGDEWCGNCRTKITGD